MLLYVVVFSLRNPPPNRLSSRPLNRLLPKFKNEEHSPPVDDDFGAIGNNIALRALRPLRLLASLRGFQLITRRIGRLLPALSGLVGALLAIFFIYAQLGVALFGGHFRITDWPSDKAPDNYVLRNFNDVGMALITLFELLVVNNWYARRAVALSDSTRRTRWLGEGVAHGVDTCQVPRHGGHGPLRRRRLARLLLHLVLPRRGRRGEPAHLLPAGDDRLHQDQPRPRRRPR